MLARMSENRRSCVKPSISIVIPVHNVEAYLRECLDSVVHQTWKDIEIICIDDASTDGSSAILQEVAQGDSRIRLISYPENRSMSQARKDGVMAATGEFIMFLDADDYLDRDACEILLRHMRELNVDILHFGTRVINAGNTSDKRVESLRAYTLPYPGRLEGQQVFDGFFREGLYHHTLWNKLYSAELCKRAFPHVEDGVFLKAQDLYAFVIIAFFARSYVGLTDVELANYRFGSGVTGRRQMTFDHFQRFCSQSKVPHAVRQFLEEQGVFEAYQEEYKKLHDHLLGDCAWNWLDCLTPRDRPRGFDLLVQKWGAVDTISCLTRNRWNQRAKIAKSVAGTQALTCRKSEIKTIGVYYHWISIGGLQRVLCNLIAMWLDMGYRVVLFTDEPPSVDDYPLPECVKRVVVPSRFETDADNYDERAAVFEKSLVENEVDLMVYHAWASKFLLWDMLLVKSQGIPFTVITHSVFSFMLITGNPYFPELPVIYGLCDAVVSLSRVDQRFWSHFTARASYLPNPLMIDLEHTPCSKLDNQDVLWVGRFSREKRPLDALRIIAKVVQSVPTARLIMLGSGSDEEYNARIQQEIDVLGIQDHVVLCGFHKEVGPFYEAASVYLSTSRYEGFPMGMAESKSHGLPCVMYQLPFLEMCRDGEGFVAVEHRDIQSAADEIVTLLTDEDYRTQMAAAARRSLQHYVEFDLEGAWRQIFDSVVDGAPAATVGGAVDETSKIMMQTLFAHYKQGRGLMTALERKRCKLEETQERLREVLGKSKKALKKSRKDNVRVRQQQKSLQQSWAMRIGTMILYIPNLLLHGVNQCRIWWRRQ